MRSKVPCCIALTIAGVLGFLVVAYAAPLAESDSFNAADRGLFKMTKAKTGKSDAEIYQELGFSYFRQENFDRAFLYFNAAVNADPKLYWSWYYLGLCNLSDGETYFKKAIGANPAFAPSYYWLGRIYEKKEKISEALKQYDAYLKMAASDPREAGRIQDVNKRIQALKKG